MDTLGSLVDKLSITNIKIWMVQDKVYKAAKENVDLEAKYVQDLASLNLLRNQLMVEIDKTLANAVCDGVVLMDPRVKIT